MSSKRIFFLLILFFQIWLVAKGQTVSYYTGDKVRPDDSSYFHIYSYDSSRLFVFRVTTVGLKNNYQLEIYSRDSLKRLDTIPVPFVATNSRVYHLENLFIHENHYQVLYSWYNASSQKVKLEMINFDSDGIKIGETVLLDSSEGWNEKKAGDFAVYNIQEKNEFLCYVQKYVKGKLMINIDHFGYDGKKLRTTNFENVKMAYVAHEEIDRNGGIIYITRGRMDSDNPDWKLRIFSPASDTAFNIPLQRANEEKVYLREKFYSYTGTDGKMYLMTTYSENEDSKYSEGLYMVRFDPKNQYLLKDEFIPFNAKAGGNDEDFSMKSCIITNVTGLHGGMLNVFFESRSVTDESFYKENTYGNILSVEVDANFRMVSLCRINKKQVVNTAAFGGYLTGVVGYALSTVIPVRPDAKNEITSFACLKKNEKVYIIFNDLQENFSREGKPKAVRKSNLNETSSVLVTLDNNKIADKRFLIEKKDPLQIDALQIYSSMRTDENELYTFRQIGEESFLTKIFFKEK